MTALLLYQPAPRQGCNTYACAQVSLVQSQLAQAGCITTFVFAGRQVVKNEPLQITYSYWDGTGHRRKVVVRKGDTISQFLKAVKLQLSEEFRELR